MAFPSYGTTVPTLANYQAAYNGVIFGGTGSNATAYGLTQITGLDAPAIMNGDIQRPRDLGESIGLDVYGGRDVTLAGDVQTNGTSLASSLQALAQATVVSGVTETPLWVQLPGLPLLGTLARVRKRSMPVDVTWGGGLASMALQFHCTDPRLYAAPQQATVGLPTPGTGITFPVTFPASFGGGSSAGVVSVTNTGNIETRPVLVITGPCTNPVVYNATTGWRISVSNPNQTGYTLNAGDTLTIDTDLHTVTYTASGTTVGAARRNWIVAGTTWPNYVGGIAGLAPGANTIQFTSGDSGAVAGQLAVQYASAYMI